MKSDKKCLGCGGSGPFGFTGKYLKSRCKKCLAAKQATYVAEHPEVWFKWSRENADYLKEKDAKRYAADPEGAKARVTAYRKENPELAKKWAEICKLRKYGLTLEDKEEMLQAQGGKCPICEKQLEEGRGGTSIDHDHSTKRVRGILCGTCNVMLGDFQEDLNILQSAVSYLKSGKVVVVGTAPQRKPTKRGANLWDKYRLTELDYDRVISEQGGKCAICQTPLKNGQVDHEHSTGAVRGILCRACNLGLGHAQDSPDVIERGVSYLQWYLVPA